MSSNERLDPVEVIKRNQKRASELSNEKARLLMRKEQNEQQLKKLQEEALSKFGTSDLESLRKLYTEYRQADKDAAVSYVTSLDNVESIINKIKSDLAAVE